MTEQNATTVELTPAQTATHLRANKKIVEESTCGICGKNFDLGGELMRCEGCHNVFHMPCWEHSGGCNQATCKGATKICPFCKKEIKEEAIKCRYCGHYLDETIQAKIGTLDERLHKYVFKASGTTRVGMNIMAFIGVFIFGWLLIVVFSRLGRIGLGWAYFGGAFILFRIAEQGGEPALIILAALLYIAGWVHANVIFSQYKRLAQERIEQIDQHSGGTDGQLEKGLLICKVLGDKEKGRPILQHAVDQPGGSDDLVTKAKQLLA